MFSLPSPSSDIKVPIIGSTPLGLPVAQNFFDLTLKDVKKRKGCNKSQAVRVPYSVLSLNALDES